MISAAEAKRQYARAKQHGWLPAFFAACVNRPWLTAADLLGIGSRETNLDPRYLTITGDHGNGFGLMQVDKRYFPDWVQTGKWRDARECIEKGAEVLAQKRAEIIAKEGHLVTWKTSKGQRMSFRGAPFSDEQLRRISIAAYNSGIAAYHHFSTSGLPDKGTTGRDYSADVLARAAMFAALIEADKVGGSESPSIAETQPLPAPDVPVAASTGTVATLVGGGAVAVAGGAAVATSGATDGVSWIVIAVVGLILIGIATLGALWFFGRRES